MFDSHSVGTGISSSASSSLSLFLRSLSSDDENRVLQYPSRSHAYASAQIRTLSLSHTLSLPLLPCLARSFFLSLDPFSFSSPLVVSAGRSAPDYLGSECLIEALYRWDPALLASLARPTPPHGVWCRRHSLSSSSSSFSSFSFLLPRVLGCSSSFLSFPLTLVLCTHHLLPILLHLSLRLFVYLLVADTSLPRQIYR